MSRRKVRCWKSLVMLMVSAVSTPAWGQFTTIINAPPYPVPTQIPSHTQVNIYALGTANSPIVVGTLGETSVDAELNLLGGRLNSWVDIHAGGVVNIEDGFATYPNAILWVRQGGRLTVSGGTIGNNNLKAEVGGLVEISGGTIGSHARAGSGSLLRLLGGTVGNSLTVEAGGTLEIHGGSFGDALTVDEGGILHIYGNEFLVDNDIRLAQGTYIPSELEVLSGVLVDGTPFVIAKSDLDNVAAIELHSARIPDIEQTLLIPPFEEIPKGVRDGQTLVASSEANLPANFGVAPGGTLIVSGGSIGDNLEILGGLAVINAGNVGRDADAFIDSQVIISGGSVLSGFQAHRASVVTLSGGSLGTGASALDGSRFDILGGTLGSGFQAQGGSQVAVAGGTIGAGFRALEASEVAISGGALGTMRFESGASVEIQGGDFRIDGLPIDGLANIGQRRQLELPAGSVLSGTLKDGTPFIMAEGDGDLLASGAVELVRSDLPTNIPALIEVPGDPAPLGVREGQTIIVRNLPQGSLGANFQAGWGSRVRIEGGHVGPEFEGVGTEIVMTSGTFADNADLFFGATLDMQGGRIFRGMNLWDGSRADVHGGTLDQFISHAGSVISVHGGTIGTGPSVSGELNILGGFVGQLLVAREGGRVAISGGTLGSYARLEAGSQMEIAGGIVAGALRAGSESRVSLRGGTVGDRLLADAGSAVDIFGGDFRLDGVPLVGFGSNDSLPFDIPTGSVLSGVLADGTPFLLTDNERGGPAFPPRGSTDEGVSAAGLIDNPTGDILAPGTLTLHRVEVPAAAPGVYFADGEPQLYGIRQGQTMVVGPDQSLAESFQAGRGSTLLVRNDQKQMGQIGRNLEAEGATVILQGGTIRPYADLFAESSLYMTGGQVQENLDVWQSTIRLSGGNIDHNMHMWGGSTLEMNGGSISTGFRVEESTVRVTAGTISGGFVIADQAVVEMTGGLAGLTNVEAGGKLTLFAGSRVNNLIAHGGSLVELRGGIVTGQHVAMEGAQIDVYGGTGFEGMTLLAGSELHLYGSDFSLDNESLLPMLNVGEPYVITDRLERLGGRLGDGRGFSLSLGREGVSPEALITITLLPASPGDFNRDGHVDAHDYIVWRNNLGATLHPGNGADGDLSGIVDLGDYLLWREHYQSGRPIRPQRGSVPEPSTWLSLLVAGAALASQRRRLWRPH